VQVSFRPRLLHDVAVPPTEPVVVVETFLAALAAMDLDFAGELVDENVVYVNVGMPPVHGRRRMLRLFRPLARRNIGLEIYLHAIAANGATVLTDRTDALTFGRFRFQFWVVGRFDVQDGRITYWRESFDYLDVLRSVGRAVAGAVVPPLRPKAPSSPDVQPGRH
jgi:limonene-1,2-epoxide hydrolase